MEDRITASMPIRDELRDVPDLPAALRALLQQVPSGKISTPGDLAQALGDRQAAPWIGHWLRHHTHDAHCRCACIVALRVADERARFREFQSERPLLRLRAIQEQRHYEVRHQAMPEPPRSVGAVDVAYPRDGHARAAYAQVDALSGELVRSFTLEAPVRFPYVCTFLSFREGPILLDLLAVLAAEENGPELLLIDGSGQLHPRHLGLATHVGLAADLPTIGVAKSLLCGRVTETSEELSGCAAVLLDGQVIAGALSATRRGGRPIYISPGHLMDVPSACRIAVQLRTGHRLPEPLYWADRLSRREGYSPLPALSNAATR